MLKFILLSFIGDLSCDGKCFPASVKFATFKVSLNGSYLHEPFSRRSDRALCSSLSSLTVII